MSDDRATRWEVRLPGVPVPVRFDDRENALVFARQQAGGHPGEVVLSGLDAEDREVETERFRQNA